MIENETERLELKLAGLGGQGVLLAGQVLARAGVKRYRHVSWFPSYGVRMRGGESTCTVILSQGRIHAPILSRPRAMIIMHNSSLHRFASTVATDGLIVVDSSLVDREVGRDDVAVCRMAANEIAAELGSTQLANLVLLGAFIKKQRALALGEIEDTIGEMLAESGKERHLAANREALRRGFDGAA